MPELPEIETVRRSLQSILEGVRIVHIKVFLARQLATHEPDEFAEELEGRRFDEFERRGKYLIFGFDNGLRLVVHLRMTGQLFVTGPDKPRDKHTHVSFGLDNARELRYRDVRRFGRLYLLDALPFKEQEAAPKGLCNLGVEPLSAGFSEGKVCAELREHRAMLKPLLLRQDIIAGLGNIYVDEALHRARLHPERTASSLSREACLRLLDAIRAVLREAIRWGGTTLSDFRDGCGRTGGFRERLRVYGREGEPCCQCGTPLKKLRVGGRSTHFCPKCQPAEPKPERGNSP